LLHGFGRKVYLNGKVEIGWFEEGKITGYCFQRESNGTITEGVFNTVDIGEVIDGQRKVDVQYTGRKSGNTFQSLIFDR
jgi:hypothetical protein